MRIFLILLLVVSFLEAKKKVDIKAVANEYSEFLKIEVGEEEWEKLFKEAKRDKHFRDGLKALGTKQKVDKYKFKDGKKFVAYFPDNKTAIKELSKTHSLLGAFIGARVVVMVYRNQNAKINKKYGVPFAETLMRYKVCEGYLYYGDYMKDTYGDKESAIKTWKSAENGCIGREWIKWNIRARYAE